MSSCIFVHWSVKTPRSGKIVKNSNERPLMLSIRHTRWMTRGARNRWRLFTVMTKRGKRNSLQSINWNINSCVSDRLAALAGRRKNGRPIFGPIESLVYVTICIEWALVHFLYCCRGKNVLNIFLDIQLITTRGDKSAINNYKIKIYTIYGRFNQSCRMKNEILCIWQSRRLKNTYFFVVVSFRLVQT